MQHQLTQHFVLNAEQSTNMVKKYAKKQPRKQYDFSGSFDVKPDNNAASSH